MSVFNWVIALSPADTGLLLEVDAVNGIGFPNGPPWPKTTVTEMGNGFYLFSDGAPPRDGYLLARLAGGGPPLAMRGITGADVLDVQPDGSVLVGSIQGDVYGGLYGGIFCDVYGRVLGDPDAGQGDPFVGPGVHLDPADPALPTGGADPTTIAAAVWDRLTSLLTTPGSIGAFVLAKLGALGTGSVVMQSPLSSDGGTMRVISGDSYESTSSARPFEWVDTTDQLAGLTVASVVWVGAGLTKAVTPFTASGHKAFRLELSKTETAAMQPRNEPPYDWDLRLTLAGDSDEITWKQGKLRVRPRAT